SIQVIEHVADPVGFLRDAGRLLRKDSGRLFITTPNRRDFLMKALPDIYPAFFYRRAHRWYFDNASLARCAAKAGLKVEVTGALQRYGLSNTLLWMRDGRPSGGAVLPGIDEGADSYWKTYLEQSGTAEMLFMTFRP
ncbi:MAG: methyltransferase domain-containing protein, partial [Rhodospirillales bacterium]